MKTKRTGLHTVLPVCVFLGLLLISAEIFGQDAPAVTIDLTVKNFKFNEKTLKVPAGAHVTIRFSNRDEGIPHNFALYTDKSAADLLFKGEVIIGVEKTDYTFTAPEKPGAYYFRCDIHPIQMNGTFTVE